MARDGSQAAAHRTVFGRTHIWLCASLVVAVLVVGMTGSSPARVDWAQAREAATSLPVQGVYEYCAPLTSSDGCVGRLRQIAAAGFRVVLNYQMFVADRSQLEHYMSAAESLGVKLISPMQDTPWWGSGSLTKLYPALAASCGCSDNEGFARYLVGLVRHSRATWGYYLSDEQSPKDARPVTAFSRRLHALDPHHSRLAVALGDDNVTQLLAPYAPAADVLGADSYPTGAGQPVSRVSQIAHAVAKVAHAKHRQPAMVLQSFDWAQYPNAMPAARPQWPTRRQMREMRDLALHHAHPSLILWYSYFNIQQSPPAEQHWRDLVWAAFGK